MSKIPIALLKTRSTPTDSYEEYFTTQSSRFTPTFIPVLEHLPNETSLSTIASLLKNDDLNQKYGGMIFTSQRAVEGFARVVQEAETESKDNAKRTLKPNLSPTSFPLYTVGPATSRTLATLLSTSRLLQALHPQVIGSETGNGAALASFILRHYNDLHSRLIYDLYEAPRLPFIPLVGDRSEQYGVRGRLERDDVRLAKKPLLFLVGETRRDIIPRTLLDDTLGERRIMVEEVEVYRTVLMADFESKFTALINKIHEEPVMVVVVFSPSGCEAVLRVLELLDERGQANKLGSRKGAVIATIGPTTRDYLKDTFGFEPDVVAEKPNPEGVGKGVEAWLKIDRETM